MEAAAQTLFDPEPEAPPTSPATPPLLAFTIEGEAKTAGSKKAFAIPVGEPLWFEVTDEMEPGAYRVRGTDAGAYYVANRDLELRVGRINITDDVGKPGKLWRKAVQEAARDAFDGPLLEGALRVDMVFHRRRPLDHYGTGRNEGVLKPNAPRRPTGRPDALKLARAVEDALTDVVWTDDALVTDGRQRKVYKGWAEPERADVTIWRDE